MYTFTELTEQYINYTSMKMLKVKKNFLTQLLGPILRDSEVVDV